MLDRRTTPSLFCQEGIFTSITAKVKLFPIQVQSHCIATGDINGALWILHHHIIGPQGSMAGGLCLLLHRTADPGLEGTVNNNH